jgi:hypothetical protein
MCTITNRILCNKQDKNWRRKKTFCRNGTNKQFASISSSVCIALMKLTKQVQTTVHIFWWKFYENKTLFDKDKVKTEKCAQNSV